jgi:hypothetical protein
MVGEVTGKENENETSIFLHTRCDNHMNFPFPYVTLLTTLRSMKKA